MTLREALLRGRRRPRNLGTGSPTIYRGDGYEFVELRAYIAGDDVRRIDWAATARSGELQTRVVLEDVALTLAAIVDRSRSMRVGRRRPLLEAAQEALDSWFGAGRADDRCVRIGTRGITPAPLQRSARAASLAPVDDEGGAFDPARVLRTARAALARGTALLAVSDWYELRPEHETLLGELGSRFDCTALITRDPWFDRLPLRGMVRLRGAEGGHVRAFVGARERTAYAKAVREREAALRERFTRAGWRTGVLHERDGAASLAAAFGIGREQ